MSSGQWRGATCLHRAATALGSRHTRGVPHQWPQRCHASLDLRGRASRRGTGTTSGAAPLVHGRGRAAGAHTGVVLWLPIIAQHDGGTARLIPVWFKKVDRLAVLVAIMKHLSLDFARLTRTVLHCKLSSSEAALWDSALGNEQTRCQRPVYIMEMQEQHGRLLSLSHAGSVNPPADDDGGQEITEVVEQSQEQEVAEVVEQPQEQQVAAGNGRTEIGDAVHDQVEAAEAETERPHLVHDQVAS
jgi:hypothetical protein